MTGNEMGVACGTCGGKRGKGKGEGKAIPVKAYAGPQGFRWLRLPDFKTFGS